MIVLDTNVISEMMRFRPADAVADWFKRLSRRNVFTTTITYGEIFAGIEMMPTGRKRNELVKEARALFAKEFEDRVLDFDRNAAEHYASIVASRKRRGRRIEPVDAQIAAITRAHDMSLATRNLSHFEDCGVPLIDPWNV